VLLMPADTPTAAQLSIVISQVTAPSFLLGAVAAFISVLIARAAHRAAQLDPIVALRFE
jgi:hypothetical protein